MKRAAFISDQDIASVTVRLQPSPNKSYKAQLREKKLVKRLNGGESAVLDYLDSRTNIDQLKESGHRRAWPMLKTIAEKTGLSIRTVQRSIEGLSRKGFIEADGLVGRSIRWRLTIPGEGPQQLVMFEECGGKNVRLNTSRLSGSDGQSLQPNIRNEEDDKEVDKHVDSDDVDFERGDEEEDEEIRAGRILESVRPKLTPNQIAIALRYRPDPDRLEALIRKLKRDPKVRNLASYLYNSIIHGMDNAPPAPLRRAMPVAATDEEIIQRRRQREIIESLRRRGILGEAVDQAIAHAEQNERLGKFIGDIWRRDDRNNPTLAPLREAVCAIAAEIVREKRAGVTS